LIGLIELIELTGLIELVDRAVSFSIRNPQSGIPNRKADRGGFWDNPKSAIRNPKSKGCRIGIKIQSLPFTSVKPSAYYKFTYTTDAVVAKSSGFYIGCHINEQFRS
jgi:hypothetical protein